MSPEESEPAATSGDSLPRTRRGQASRERLVEAAAASIVDHGIKELRVDAVLEAAGSSKSQLYHYFSDRDALIAAAVSHRCDGFLDLLASAFAEVSSLEMLATVLHGFVDDYAVDLGGCPIGTLASELTSGPEPARGRVVEAFALWEQYLVAALERIQAAGDLGSEHDAGELALGLLASLEGGMFLSQVRRSDRPLRVALDSALSYLTSLAPQLD